MRDLHSNMFLLRRDDETDRINELADLHSNMFLLRRMLEFVISCVFLYLHSNMFLLRLRAVHSIPPLYRIYIPICFY